MCPISFSLLGTPPKKFDPTNFKKYQKVLSVTLEQGGIIDCLSSGITLWSVKSKEREPKRHLGINDQSKLLKLFPELSSMLNNAQKCLTIARLGIQTFFFAGLPLFSPIGIKMMGQNVIQRESIFSYLYAFYCSTIKKQMTRESSWILKKEKSSLPQTCSLWP